MVIVAYSQHMPLYSDIFQHISKYFKIFQPFQHFIPFQHLKISNNFNKIPTFQILSTYFNLPNIFSVFPVNTFSLQVVHICGGDFRLEMTDFYGKEGGIAIKRPHPPINLNSLFSSVLSFTYMLNRLCFNKV